MKVIYEGKIKFSYVYNRTLHKDVHVHNVFVYFYNQD